MSQIMNAVCWALLILAASYLAREGGLGENARFGIVAALSGAAIGSLARSRRRCGAC